VLPTGTMLRKQASPCTRIRRQDHAVFVPRSKGAYLALTAYGQDRPPDLVDDRGVSGIQHDPQRDRAPRRAKTAIPQIHPQKIGVLVGRDARMREPLAYAAARGCDAASRDNRRVAGK
jgi:hypothetical protein